MNQWTQLILTRRAPSTPRHPAHTVDERGMSTSPRTPTEGTHFMAENATFIAAPQGLCLTNSYITNGEPTTDTYAVVAFRVRGEELVPYVIPKEGVTAVAADSAFPTANSKAISFVWR